MQDSKTMSVTIKMTEETANKLTQRALASDLTLNDFVVKLIDDEASERIDALEESVRHLESLVWRGIYWSALPFIEGIPKQRLNEEGLEHFWNRSGDFAQRFARPTSTNDQ